MMNGRTEGQTQHDQKTACGKSPLAAGLERTNLTAEEHVALVCAARRDSVLECAFGCGFITLLPTTGNKWAFEMLADMRSKMDSNEAKECGTSTL